MVFIFLKINILCNTASPYKKLTKDVELVGIAQVVGVLKGLILLPILTKTLGTEMYDTWALIMAAIALIMLLALLQQCWALRRSDFGCRIITVKS